MRKQLALSAGLFLFMGTVHAALITTINLCAQAYPTEAGPVLNCSAAGDTDTTLNSVVTELAYDVSGLDPQGSYSGYGYVSMTQDTFRLKGSVSVADYARKNRVNIADPFVLQGMALSLGIMTDTLTVEGGTGVYNLNYILSVDGTFASDPDFYSFFCAVLAIPQGVGTVSGFCTAPGGGASTLVTLSYADLPFGGPVTPVLAMNILASLDSLMPDQVEALGDTLVTGGAFADYGSTIHLQGLLITDASGRPIPGITYQSSSGYTYALDPGNAAGAVPEPSTLALIALALAMAAVGLRRRR